MDSESEVRLFVVQTPEDEEGTGWSLSSPLLLTSLPHDYSCASLLGLRIPSAGYALEQGNANNVKAFYLVLLSCYRIDTSPHFNLIYLTISRTELKEANLVFCWKNMIIFQHLSISIERKASPKRN